MKKTLATLATGALLLAGGSMAQAQDGYRHPRLPTTPCTSDTQADCFYDAGSMSGRGKHSFWVVFKSPGHCIRYLDPAVNLMRGGCYEPRPAGPGGR